jgi:hypothetical protein
MDARSTTPNDSPPDPGKETSPASTVLYGDFKLIDGKGIVILDGLRLAFKAEVGHIQPVALGTKGTKSKNNSPIAGSGDVLVNLLDKAPASFFETLRSFVPMTWQDFGNHAKEHGLVPPLTMMAGSMATHKLVSNGCLYHTKYRLSLVSAIDNVSRGRNYVQVIDATSWPSSVAVNITDLRKLKLCGNALLEYVFNQAPPDALSAVCAAPPMSVEMMVQEISSKTMIHICSSDIGLFYKALKCSRPGDAIVVGSRRYHFARHAQGIRLQELK